MLSFIIYTVNECRTSVLRSCDILGYLHWNKFRIIGTEHKSVSFYVSVPRGPLYMPWAGDHHHFQLINSGSVPKAVLSVKYTIVFLVSNSLQPVKIMTVLFCALSSMNGHSLGLWGHSTWVQEGFTIHRLRCFPSTAKTTRFLWNQSRFFLLGQSQLPVQNTPTQHSQPPDTLISVPFTNSH